MNARAALAVALALAAGPGCWWSSPPTGPHGHAELDVDQVPLLAPKDPARLTSTRLVLLGRFESVAPQPIGGMYDRDEYYVTPLYRTYFFKDAPLELFEHTCDALRAAGLDVRKDYATSGEPVLVEPQLRAQDPAIVTATITSLQHDQIHFGGSAPHDDEVAQLGIRVRVLSKDGAELYRKDHVVYGRTPFNPEGGNLLRLVGLELGGRLSRDPAFVRAVGAS